MHTSIKLDTPVEFVNITPLNSLISKCQIKVCYVGEDPNRNGSIITKEVAKEMANSLPGCPIVGFYNEEKKDFEEHNRVIDISNGKFEIKDVTRPYGFVDLGAKVWFQKYLDDNKNEHEYLMTEGWLWTSQYPECQRILTQSNNQSMELDPDTLDGKWSESDNDHPSFFIINEAMISKLCILGEENEPCFEGANVSAPTIQFSFEKGFKDQLFSMMNELKELLNEGGKKVFTKYAVEIGDNVWNALYQHVNGEYSINSVCEEEGKPFAIVASEDKYYRLNFNVAEDGTVEFDNEYSLMEDYAPDAEPQFNPEDVKTYVASLEEGDKDVENPEGNAQVDGEPSAESEPEGKNSLEKEDKGIQYNLNDIQEYVELREQYSALEQKFAEATTTIETLTTENQTLTEFKSNVEKVEKKKMIDSFYMLSEEDKKDVIDNMDKYSVEDIEAKLSVICVRNKVSFNLDDNSNNNNSGITFNLNNNNDEHIPDWVKAIRRVAEEKDN